MPTDAHGVTAGTDLPNSLLQSPESVRSLRTLYSCTLTHRIVYHCPATVWLVSHQQPAAGAPCTKHKYVGSRVPVR